MFIKALTIGCAALALAMPAAAQERGTMEFGAFISAATFDKDLSLNKAAGGGGRIGMFLDPRWSVEFEDAQMRATRPNGLRTVAVGILSGRLVYVPLTSGKISLLTGIGAGVGTETNFLHSYGVQGLAGVKYALNPNAAVRVDGLVDFLAHYDMKSYKTVRMGLTLYRHPNRVATQ